MDKEMVFILYAVWYLMEFISFLLFLVSPKLLNKQKKTKKQKRVKYKFNPPFVYLLPWRFRITSHPSAPSPLSPKYTLNLCRVRCFPTLIHQFWHVPKTCAWGGLTSASLACWKAKVTELPSTPPKEQMAPPAKAMRETLRGLASFASARQHFL